MLATQFRPPGNLVRCTFFQISIHFSGQMYSLAVSPLERTHTLALLVGVYITGFSTRIVLKVNTKMDPQNMQFCSIRLSLSIKRALNILSV